VIRFSFLVSGVELQYCTKMNVIEEKVEQRETSNESPL